jgi:hypothetical protein
MRSISEQDVAEMGGRGSVLARQKRDHVELDRLLGRLDSAAPGREGAVLLEIYRLVFPHAFAEEAVLWPAIRRVLPDGEALTLQVEIEHQRINELVTELEALAPGSAAHGEVLERVVALLREDVRDEEDVLLPRLQERLSAGALRRLGLAWEAVRAIAPTRAHPIVARRPPGNVLSALPLALIDRCRDLVDTRIARGADGEALARVSAALARASHAVERLPGLRSGENPATRIPRSRGGRWGTAAVFAAGVGSLAVIAARRRQAGALTA